VRNAGVEVLRVEVDRTGKIVVVAGEPGKTDLPTTEGNSWDVVWSFPGLYTPTSTDMGGLDTTYVARAIRTLRSLAFDQLSDHEILAAFSRNAEEQRQVLWSGAQAFCRVHPDDRMCTRPQWQEMTAPARRGRWAEPSFFGEATPRAMREHCVCRPASYIDDARPRSHSAVIGFSPLSNIEQISIQLRCNIFAGWVSNSMGNSHARITTYR
jgi:hypothetical protein